MTIEKLVEDVIAFKNKTITDDVFLTIQNERCFMQEYLRLVQEQGKDNVNKQIGKLVKKAYSLTNDDGRGKEPTSTLIGSYQEFQ